MKKRVRIYKPTDNYFQDGGEQVQQLSDDDIIMFIMQTLSQPDGSMDQAKTALMEAQIDPARISRLSNAASEYIEQQQDAQLANNIEDYDTALELQQEQDQLTAEAAEEEGARQAQMLQEQMMYSADEGDYLGNAEDDSDLYMKYGGKIPSKRTFVKNAVKLAKKQMGGKPDISTDLPVNGRTEQLNKFIGSVQSTATDASLKKQAEELYNQQFGQDQMSVDPGMEASQDMYAAQFGGMRPGQQRRAMRRMNRMYPVGMVPGTNMFSVNQLSNFIPQNFNPSDQYPSYGLANIDVRRTGLFGRPKEYTINFAQTQPRTQKAVVKEADDVVEQELRNKKVLSDDEINKLIGDDVSTQTEDVATEDKEETPEEVKESDIKVVSNKSQPKSSASSEKKDAWGRTKDDKWYGFDPETKKWTQGTPDWANKAKTEQKVDVPVKSPSKAATPGITSGLMSELNKVGQQEIMRKKKIDALPYIQKQLYYAEHPEDRPVVTPGKKIENKPQSGSSTLRNIQNKLNMFGMFFQEGGFTQEDSGLYRFIGGGEDELDMDYQYSKNINDPYFGYGGYFETAGQSDSTPVDILDSNGNVVRQGTLAEAERAGLNHRIKKETSSNNNQANTNTRTTNRQPASNQRYPGYNPVGPIYPPLFPRMFGPGRAVTYAGSWQRQMGSPYRTGSNQPFTGMIGPGAQLSSIDVKRSGLFGQPKKYTMNFSVPGAPAQSKVPVMYRGSDGQMRVLGQDSNQGKDAKVNTEDTEPKRRESRLMAIIRAKRTPFTAPDEREGQAKLSDNLETKKLSTIETPEKDLATDRFNKPTVGTLATREAQPMEQEFSKTITPDADIMKRDMMSQQMAESQVPQSEMSPVMNLSGPMSTEGEDMFAQPEDERMDYASNQLQIEPSQYSTMFDGYAKESEIAQRLNENLGQDFQYPSATPIVPEMLSQSGYDRQQARLEDRRRQIEQQKIQQALRNEKVNTAGSRNVGSNQSDESNWLDRSTNNMSRQQRMDFQNKQGNAFIQLQDLKSKIEGSSPGTFRKSTQGVLNPNEIKQFNRLSPSQKLDLIKQFEKIDRSKYEAYISQLKYGGLPQADPGGVFSEYGDKVPLGYFKDPKTGLVKNFAGDVYSPKTNLDYKAGEMLDNPFTVKSNPLTGATTMGFDASGEAYKNAGLETDAEKEAKNRQNVSVDVKNENMWTIDPELAVNKFNQAVGWGLDQAAQWDARNKEKAGYRKLSSENLFATTTAPNKGTYEINSGDFRPNQTGFTGVVQYGGYMPAFDEYEPEYSDGDETYMSEDQIRDFLANGGEIEFI
jgi:hypothetical protein